jgi:hypothetical protein
MEVEKQAVSVAEMARMVGLSRARFYQLVVGGTFPSPVYDVKSRRPYYTEELQAICLDVRRRNFGIDQKPILFYTRRMVIAPTVPKRAVKKPAPANDQHDDLIDGLRALGLMTVTGIQVAAAAKELYPNGVDGIDEGEVLRAVFLAIKCRDSADNLT